MGKAIIHCDRCRLGINTDIEILIDGSEYGHDLVCAPCMRTLEGAYVISERHWLDLIKYTLPIRVSHGVELLETTSLPRWYFIRIGSDIVFQGECSATAKGVFYQRVEQEKFKQSALYRLANGGK